MLSTVINWMGWDWLAALASVVGLVAAALFVVRYQVESRGAWAGNPYGRYLMQRKALLIGLFGLIIFNRAEAGTIQIPDAWPGQGMIMALLYLAFALQTFVPYRLLVEARQERVHDEEATQ
jgi:hypothetical protein